MYPKSHYINRGDPLVNAALGAGYRFLGNVVDPLESPKSQRGSLAHQFFVSKQSTLVPDLDDVENFTSVASENEDSAAREINSRIYAQILLPAYKAGGITPIREAEDGINMYALFTLNQ